MSETPPSAPIADFYEAAKLVTLFGCVPAGLVALSFSAKVRIKSALGDDLGALECSAKARKWCYLAAGLGVAMWALALTALLFVNPTVDVR